jgi:hypothetical protein
MLLSGRGHTGGSTDEPWAALIPLRNLNVADVHN